ncbi:hypothetical protein ACLIOB_002153 [Vibrio cholerae]|uniref:hypothetical protein n=1 Tax=Vibrio TaxID=662 RepID=UPI0005C641D1|nr:MULTISPECIES: hypothetical protein [Vibrio]EGR2240180.1 hypothetical protein [Vibrio cholerae]EGR4434778.1 hypothetical protein [Vibrio cholerae]EGR4450398.1 hypothetical protein [Vibrio cholerae]EJL6376521.1 hypothetical protein [Vibrio cholerae]EJL6412277.1 hypothetical protein [Vibrio cholerae]
MGKLLDLADRSLENKTKEELLMADIKLHGNNFILYPPFFNRADDLPDLEWEKVSFTPENRNKLPKLKGVYAFAIEISKGGLPPSTLILYVGKAGDLNSGNSLWKRYYDYIRTEKKNDRPRIGEMLRRWKGHLSYYYATVDENISTGMVEETLLDVLIPPYNRGDFSPELNSLLKGANIL